MKEQRKNKGITLIALVVTIVILIILATITLNIILGENGIIERAKQAKLDADFANVKEQLQLELLGLSTANITERIEQSKVEEILNKYGTVEKDDSGNIDGVILDGSNTKIPIKEVIDTEMSKWIVTKSKVIGGTENDMIRSIIKDKDGNYIISGGYRGTTTTNLTSEGDLDSYIGKYDKDFNLIWETSYGNALEDCFDKVIEEEECYTALGHTNENATPGNDYQRVLINKYNKNTGSLISTNLYNHSSWINGAKDIAKIEDGYIIIDFGWIWGIENGWSGVLVKLDNNFNKIWSRELPSDFRDLLVIDNGYITVGNKLNKIAFTKYDKNGNVLNEVQYHTEATWGEGMSITSDGNNGYIIAGYVTTEGLTGLNPAGGKEAILIKVDAEGNRIKEVIFGGAEDDVFNKIINTSDGGYLVSGKINQDGMGNVIKVNKNLEVEWSAIIEPKNILEVRDLVEDNGNYIIAAETWQGESFDLIGNVDIILMKLEKV